MEEPGKSQVDSSSSGGDQSTVIDKNKMGEEVTEVQSETLPVVEIPQVEATVEIENKGVEKEAEVPEVKEIDIEVPENSKEAPAATEKVQEDVPEVQELLIFGLPQPSTSLVVDEDQKKDQNVTPNLMDESIISVIDSPPPAQRPTKDSTFSPVVDTSIHDSRPNIDILNLTPSLPIKLSHRTSTPLVQKVLTHAAGGGTPKRANTPKVSIAMSSLAKTPKLAEKFESEEIDDDAFDINKSVKPVNMLEKSILKSSRRKRSMSVADAESMVQKRVMFISPQVMEIGTIDERMMASFMEERESSMVKPTTTLSSGHRKRSLSTGTPMKSQERPSRSRKMPDFKAIHQQQFDRMESIADHQARKTERAKKLVTPEVKKSKVPEASRIPQASKIPTVHNRKPLANAASSENLLENRGRSRVLKRSQSATEDEPAKKKVQLSVPVVSAAPSTSSQAKKIAVVNGLQRTKSETATWTAPSVTMSSFLGSKKPAVGKSDQKVPQMNRTKMEERREKNMSLYKTNKVQKQVADQRQKNGNILKGVRLNRRFELQMQHRRDHEDA